jgi:hypothetical protein
MGDFSISSNGFIEGVVLKAMGKKGTKLLGGEVNHFWHRLKDYDQVTLQPVN